MASTKNSIGYAEAEALKRRERILKLRRKVEGKSEEEEAKESDSQSPSHQSDDEPANDIAESEKSEEKSIKDSILNEELDLNQLAPRKIDWDLKRGIERKLEMLQEATNNAISELIRDDMVDDIKV